MELKYLISDMKLFFIIAIALLLGFFAVMVKLLVGNIFKSELVQKIIMINIYIFSVLIFIGVIYFLWTKQKSKNHAGHGHAINRL